MSKKTGLFGVLESAGLVESDIPVTAPEPASVPVQAPVTPCPQTFSAVPMAQAALTPDDQDKLKALEAQVYAAPSTYVVFRNVRESLGNTTDVAMIFKVLAAANPGVTPAKILGDIETHLGIIRAKAAEFETQIQHAKDDMADAKAKIATYQQQIAAANTQIEGLQTSIARTEKSISDGTARFHAVTDQLTAPLIATKQLLSGLK